MKKRLVILCLAIASVSTVFYSCSEDVAESIKGSIVGTVSDNTTGEAIAVAEVTLSPGNKSTVTGSDGNFSFNELEAGSYTISVHKEGYKLENYSVVVFEGKTTESHILLERTPSVITADIELLDFGENPGVTQLSFGIVNSGYVDLTWRAVCDCEWVSKIDPSNEQILKYGKTATIVVTIDRDMLTVGHNETYLIIYSDNGRTQVKITAIGPEKYLPKVNIYEATDTHLSTTTLHAEIINVGEPIYERCGFVYGKHATPTLSDNVSTAICDKDKKYSKKIEALESGETYYVRAFAESSLGVAYSSNEITFTTIGSLTEVATLDVLCDLTKMSAVFNGEIKEVGKPNYTEKGFCYNTTGEPTCSDNKVVVSGSNAGQYSYTYSSLKENNTYYVRAYAIQCGTVYYGTTTSFNTNLSTTQVTTSSATEITTTSAKLNGSVISEGSPKYSERGFCYATSSNPTINNTKIVVSGNGEGDYYTTITGLKYNTTYYYRAYAIQNSNVTYGTIVSFKTNFVNTVISTVNTTKDITYDSATLYYQCTNLGDPQCTQTGICYSTSSTSTTSSSKVYGIVSTSQQRVTITGLKEKTTYYYRAFAIQDGKTIYADDILSFTTGHKPSVSTRSVSNLENPYGLVNMWSVQLNGYVSDVGDPKITKRGFVYSSNGDPMSEGTSTTISGASTGEYSKTLSGLKSNTTYYVRAFVQNSIGKEYGNVITFTTR